MSGAQYPTSINDLFISAWSEQLEVSGSQVSSVLVSTDPTVCLYMYRHKRYGLHVSTRVTSREIIVGSIWSRIISKISRHLP